ncbi:hypothetical protein F0562_031235 [Nyssa sinensis]|uniref:Uncharacterized protein n=1 Tax=Nyssa sinensis TaxID=561372 RepID=A0A5J5ATN9_9ASTE|nr:hypothetical protein F0562_031235 [Nyssa sinensis]
MENTTCIGAEVQNPAQASLPLGLQLALSVQGPPINKPSFSRDRVRRAEKVFQTLEVQGCMDISDQLFIRETVQLWFQTL